MISSKNKSADEPSGGVLPCSGKTDTLIIFIHGANSTPLSWNYAVGIFEEQDNFDTVALSYDLSTEYSYEIVKLLEQTVRQFSDNYKKLIFIGHSYGGIFAAILGGRFPDHESKVFTLATPFAGVDVPMFVKMMSPFSIFYKNIDPNNSAVQLARATINNVPTVCYITTGSSKPEWPSAESDGVVTTLSQLALKSERTVRFNALNHFEILLEPKVFEEIVSLI
jgi:pimeloyl-ACP methyl ester carboxylesterase